MKWISLRPSSATKRLLSLGGTLVVAAIVVIGYVTLVDKPSSPDGQGPVAADTATTSGKEITELLGQLIDAPEASMSGYSREKFPHWDTNAVEHGFDATFAQYGKCTTRDVMMLRDAVGTVSLDPKSCELKIGKDGGWRDQYGVLDSKTGKVKPYKWMTDPSTVDAEHIVPLAEAWRSGAATRDENTRRNIANDAVNLVASDPSANRSKGDQDAANYLPPGNFRCGYLAHYVKIKIKYGLTVDPAEHAALRTAVDDCVRRGGYK